MPRARNPVAEFALVDKATGVEYYKVHKIQGDGKCMFRATVRPPYLVLLHMFFYARVAAHRAWVPLTDRQCLFGPHVSISVRAMEAKWHIIRNSTLL